MACPACGCKETYQYNDGEDYDLDDELIRCAACGAIFEPEDEEPEDEDDGLTANVLVEGAEGCLQPEAPSRTEG